MITKEEHHNNENYITIHIDKRIVKSGDVWYNTEYDAAKSYSLIPWLKEMQGINGIKNIAIRPYEISIVKAEVFSWDIITPKVYEIIQREYPENEIVA